MQVFISKENNFILFGILLVKYLCREVWIKDSVRPCDKGILNLKDYTHIKKDIDILKKMVKELVSIHNQKIDLYFKYKLNRKLNMTTQDNLYINVNYVGKD